VRNDPDYRANQNQCQKEWCNAHPDYWKEYRKQHPDQAKRNRDLQRLRNRKRNGRDIDRRTCSLPNQRVIAKMDASKSRETSGNASFSGQFWLVPVIAKMDALKVNIYRITACCE
jgi:chromosome segregation ATPase